MTENTKAVPRSAAPPISVPELPSSSGAWFGGVAHILRKDTEVVEASADFLHARAQQAEALHGLVTARMRVARLMVELAALPETCRREQEHKLRMLSLKNEFEATEAAILLAEARGRFAQANKGPQQAAPASGNDALSLDDVESILSQFPEFDADSISKVSMLLRALQREKSA
jgi:hypothetical protein